MNSKLQWPELQLELVVKLNLAFTESSAAVFVERRWTNRKKRKFELQSHLVYDYLRRTIKLQHTNWKLFVICTFFIRCERWVGVGWGHFHSNLAVKLGWINRISMKSLTNWHSKLFIFFYFHNQIAQILNPPPFIYKLHNRVDGRGRNGSGFVVDNFLQNMYKLDYIKCQRVRGFL